MTAGPRTQLSLWEAVLPIVAMIALFGAGAVFLELSAELLVLVLLGAAAVAGVVARRHGVSWDEIQASTGEKLAAVLPVILILLAIGMLIATWVVSGTIPLLVNWGVRLISPRYLALTAFFATSLMSLFTGTSWGSAGTIGVALMGTAVALDAPLDMTAGAVLSGAYLGDKMSPLSDSTNISAIGAGAPLYAHVRHMLYTALPSSVVAIAVYTLVAHSGAAPDAALPDQARRLLADLDSVFELNAIALLPPAIVVWGIVRRSPPALAIATSSLVAAVLGVAVQGFAAQDVLVATVGGFRAEMVAATGADAAALGPQFTALVERGGLYSMATTLVIVISAFLLAGAMDAAGALDLLIRRLLAAVRSTFGLIAATMAAGATMIGLTSHGGVTALVIGGLFQKAYADRGLAAVNLSRSIEDSVTITEPLMPWTVSAVFMATTLGVPTLDYAPWAVFCWGGPLFSLLVAATHSRTRFGIRALEGAPARAAAPAGDAAPAGSGAS